MNRHLLYLLGLGLTLSLAACGDDFTPDDSDASNNGGMNGETSAPQDMGMTGGGDTTAPTNNTTGPDTNNDVGDMSGGETTATEDMDEGPMCSEGLSACDDECLDLTRDPDNCGECGNSCGTASACSGGECVCFSPNESWCGRGECYDLSVDRQNCGTCGNVCEGFEICNEGTCTGGGVLSEVLVLTNEARSQAQNCGGDMRPPVPPLKFDPILQEAAQAHAEDMAAKRYFSHTNKEGQSSGDRIREAGYQGSATGENIARGYGTAAAVVQGWIDSPGHCRNIMRDGFNELGVGFDPNGNYWVQNFGRE